MIVKENDRARNFEMD